MSDSQLIDENNNTRIPTDILYTIFRQYAEEETPQFPLESLLLVCRFWKAVALDQKEIWAVFNIKFGIMEHELADYWARQVPHRLRRIGSHTLIFFSMQVLPTKAEVSIENYDYFSSTRINTTLNALHGPNGGYCNRWREISLAFFGWEYSPLHPDVPPFSYPTPQLISLRLCGLAVGFGGPRIFQSTPSLQHLEVLDCVIPTIPNIDNAIIVHFQVTRARVDVSPLAHMQQVKSLSMDIYNPSRVELPVSLPYLVDLHLRSSCIPDNMAELHLPCLQKLSFELWDEDSASSVLECRGIPFPQLHTLKFTLNIDLDTIYPELARICYSFLQKCNNVEFIIGDEISLPHLLGMLKDGCESENLLVDHPIHISDPMVSKQLRSGEEERIADIRTFFQELGFPRWRKRRMGAFGMVLLG